MSTLKVEVVRILDIQPHPKADRLEIATIKGWQCVVGKGNHNIGDLVVYFPIDSVLPEKIESLLFSDSKVKLHQHRIKTIKLRGAISQGLVASFKQLQIPCEKEGADLTKVLGVTKYEPELKLTTRGGFARSRKATNPNFVRYTDIENYKNFPELFEKGEEVVVTEKIHGTNFRAGWVKSVPDTWWKKVKSFFGRLPDYEFVYGSHNVQLQNGKPRNVSSVPYNNVYSKAVEKYNLKSILLPGEVIYAEIYGHGIQDNYNYGCKPGEFGIVVFDLMIDGRYQNSSDLLIFRIERGFMAPPLLYQGPFDYEKIKALTVGPSVLAPSQKVREGVVIKPKIETITYAGRKVLKLISDEYLLKEDNTEFH
ncbi:RNA ligase (ATP) [Candidatus Dojkabacteria bacterium]|jgi:RNA ligase (TIGR02306 family)|nr:RNA ligase (ATP) [Candidatus Dojkabacteria bacterium]